MTHTNIQIQKLTKTKIKFIDYKHGAVGHSYDLDQVKRLAKNGLPNTRAFFNRVLKQVEIEGRS